MGKEIASYGLARRHSRSFKASRHALQIECPHQEIGQLPARDLRCGTVVVAPTTGRDA